MRPAIRPNAIVAAETPGPDLALRIHRGVRALRFTGGGSSKVDDVACVAPKIGALGLRAEMFIGLENLIARAPDLVARCVALVPNHLAGPLDAPTATPGFQYLLALTADHDMRVRLTPVRNSARLPDYADTRPFHDAPIAARPVRTVRGSGWPFANRRPTLATLSPFSATR